MIKYNIGDRVTTMYGKGTVILYEAEEEGGLRNNYLVKLDDVPKDLPFCLKDSHERLGGLAFYGNELEKIKKEII